MLAHTFFDLNSNNLFHCLEHLLKNEGFEYDPVLSSLRLDALLRRNSMFWFCFSRVRLAMARSLQNLQNRVLRSYAGLYLCIISSNSVLFSLSNGGFASVCSMFSQYAHTSCPPLIGPTYEQVKNAHFVSENTHWFPHKKKTHTHKILFNRNNCNHFGKWNEINYAYI